MPHFHDVTIDPDGSITIPAGAAILVGAGGGAIVVEGNLDISDGGDIRVAGGGEVTLFGHATLPGGLLIMGTGTNAGRIEARSGAEIDLLSGSQVSVRAGGTIWFDPVGTDADLTGNIRINGPAKVVAPSGGLNIDVGRFLTLDGTASFLTGSTLHLDTGALTDIDNAVEFTYTGNRDKWKSIPMVPLNANAMSETIDWQFSDVWPPGSVTEQYWWHDENSPDNVVFEAELNLGVSEVLNVLVKLDGNNNVSGSPDVTPLSVGVYITDWEGSVTWSDKIDDVASGTGMNTMRSITVPVAQSIIASSDHLYIVIHGAESTLAGILRVRSIRAQYRYDRLDM